MAVSTVQNDNSSLLASLNARTSASGSTKELSDRFLTLLVTQLKNQDPMNPMENAELTSQLAQLSTVEEIGKLNTSMTSFVDQFRASQSLQAASLVGRQVLTTGDDIQLGSKGGMGAVDLEGAADQVTVRITDANGITVRVLELGQQAAGFSPFVWDGLNQSGQAAAQGAYRYTVTASQAGEKVETTSYALDQVMSVSLEEGGTYLELAGAGNRDLDQIRRIY